MLYLERLPHPTLSPFIHNYWYSCDPAAIHRHERILPNGRPQIVISLARDYLTNANHPTDPLRPQPAALFLGIYSHNQLIDTIDLTELIGITFHPGGTIPFFPDATHAFTNRETSLEELWGRAALNLRNDLRQSPTPTEKFNLLDFALRHRLTESRTPRRTPTIDYALTKLQPSPPRPPSPNSAATWASAPAASPISSTSTSASPPKPTPASSASSKPSSSCTAEQTSTGSN